MRGVELGGISKGIAVAPGIRPSAIRSIANPFQLEGRFRGFREAGGIRRHSYFPKRREYQGLSVSSVIAEAEAIVRAQQAVPIRESLVLTPEPMLWTPVRPWRGVREVRVINQPKLEAVPQLRFKPATEGRVSTRPGIAPKPAQIQSRPAPLEAKLAQVVEEKVVTKKDDQQKNSSKVREKAAVLRVKFVEAIHISEQRRAEIRLAVKKAKPMAEKLGFKGITGRLVRQLLASSFWLLKSPIVGEGQDGTIPLTAALVEADPITYPSLEEAEKGLTQTVDKHIPVKKGLGGRIATIGEVRAVIEGQEKEPVKSPAAAEIVVKRIIKLNESMGLERVVSEEKIDTGETSLKDFPPLVELFQKSSLTD